MMFERMNDAFDIRGYDQLEVFGNINRTRSFGISKNDLKNVESSENRGIGVRAVVDNRVGFASTTDPEKVLQTAKKAVKLAKVSQSTLISLPVKNDFKSVKGIYDEKLVKRESEVFLDDMSSSMEDLGEYNVSDAGIEVSEIERFVLNSHGVKASDKKSMQTCYISLSDGDVSRHAYHASTNGFSFNKVSEKAKRLVDKSSKRKNISGGRYDIVLSPSAQRQIFSGLLYPALSAETVQRGESFLEGRVEEKVFSEDVSITDDGILPQGNGTRSFDREGHGSQTTSVVEDGVLESFLYDVKHAEKEGRPSTGNASGGASSSPSISPTNFVMEGEKGKKDGDILIHSVSGVHTADRTTGEYALNITCGFDDGGETAAIKSGVLVGDVISLLKKFSHYYGDLEASGDLVTRKAVFRDQKIVV